MLFLRTRLALGRWRTCSPLGQHLLGTYHVVFSGTGLEIASRSHARALIALANSLSVVLPWE